MIIGDFEVTKREVLVCIAVTLVVIGLGILITSAVRNGINESNEVYYKALKIRDDSSVFEYALRTNVGNVLAHGKVKAINGVSISDIEGTYFRIKKVREEYTRHTREVAHTRTKSDGTTETYYTTEVYYTWDYRGQEEFKTEKFSFLDVEFSYDTIYFGNESYYDTIKVDHNTRYKYYTVPLEFEGTLFTYIENNTITKNEFYYSELDKVIEDKQHESDVTVTVFWIIWVFIIIVCNIAYLYAENKYLED